MVYVIHLLGNRLGLFVKNIVLYSLRSIYLSMWAVWYRHVCHLLCCDFHLFLYFFFRGLNRRQFGNWHLGSFCRRETTICTANLFFPTKLSVKFKKIKHIFLNFQLCLTLSTWIMKKGELDNNNLKGQRLGKLAALHHGSCLSKYLFKRYTSNNC